jgi:hypothetical protein
VAPDTSFLSETNRPTRGLSISSVVYTIFLISGAKAKNGMTCSQARRQSIAMGGYFVPHGPASNASSAAAAASAEAAR